MSASDVLTATLSGLAAVICLLLTLVHTRLGRIEDKLDGKQDKAECGTKEKRFSDELKEFWEAFGKHSHEGLPPGSKVTR